MSAPESISLTAFKPDPNHKKDNHDNNIADPSSSSSSSSQSKQSFFSSMFGSNAKKLKTKVKKKKAVVLSARQKHKMAEKEFFFRIDKIIATFESKLNGIFLEFEFGGKFLEARTETAIEKKVKKKTKDASGNVIEREVVEAEYKRVTRVYKEQAANYFTRMKNDIKPKQPITFHDHSFEGIWNGTYEDLKKEFLTIKVWQKITFGPNVLLGKVSETFSNIVSDKIERELRVTKYIPGAVYTSRRGKVMIYLNIVFLCHCIIFLNSTLIFSVALFLSLVFLYYFVSIELVCYVSFKCEFQEKFSYNIDFRDWEMRRQQAPPPDLKQKKHRYLILPVTIQLNI